MRWILAGCCWLALITITVSLQVNQKPRFLGLKTRAYASIYCLPLKSSVASTAVWYKAKVYNGQQSMISNTDRIILRNHSMTRNAIIDLRNVEIADSGVYFCEINGTKGLGTEVQIVRHVNLQQALYRTKMKDGLIILQGLLLAACIAAALLRQHRVMERRDSIYEEPENDHIYEGLAIESCGGGLYEDLTMYARAEGTEAPWE